MKPSNAALTTWPNLMLSVTRPAFLNRIGLLVKRQPVRCSRAKRRVAGGMPFVLLKFDAHNAVNLLTIFYETARQLGFFPFLASTIVLRFPIS